MDEVYQQIYKNKVNAALPPEFRDGFANFRGTCPEQVAIKAAAEKWVADWKPGSKGLQLLGAVGCGKTYTGCAILAGLLYRGISTGKHIKVSFKNSNLLFADIRASWNSREISEYHLTRQVLECDVLFLDDLGAEGSKATAPDYVQDKLYEIVNRIDMAGAPTIIFSSNFGLEPPEDEPLLTTYYGSNNGARIISRLQGLTEPLGEFPVVDMRQRKG